jgi:hypothetical protein
MRTQALLVDSHHPDMHRYLGAPEVVTYQNKEVWLKPRGVNSLWLQNGIARFASFGIIAKAGYWDGSFFDLT